MAQENIVGCILGTAVGDALGLPYEGLSRHRAARLFGPPNHYHLLLFRRGMVSDDTEHTCMVAQSLITSGQDPDTFCQSLGWRFRFWLLALPAGVGMATLRSIIRLWIGFSPQKSGVFSAGNGPAMRAAILGAALDDRQLLREFVRVSSRVTHTDPKAEFGAFAVALAAQMARRHQTITADQFLTELRSLLDDEADELTSLIAKATTSANKGQSTQAFAHSLGLTKGVSGYVFHSVPVAIHAWFVHPHDFQAAVTSIIECGGDTDSTAAIVGGIVGSAVGKRGIPAAWLDHLFEWPRSVSWMEQLGIQLDGTIKANIKSRPLEVTMWGLLPRNIFFLFVVLYHGFRRLFPPY